MLSGASTFDAVLLVAAANVKCPSPQAAAHLAALEAVNAITRDRVAVVQSKADVVMTSSKLAEHCHDLQNALANSIASDAPVFPVATLLGIGLDAVATWLASIPERPREAQVPAPLMHVIRSFDVNSPGAHVATSFKGGTIGGSLTCGQVRKGDMLEIRPGTYERCAGDFVVRPVRVRVEEIRSGKEQLQYAIPGGLVAFCTNLCPALCASDYLVGQVLGRGGMLPPVWEALRLCDMEPVSDVINGKACDDASSDSDVEHLKASAAKLAKRRKLKLNDDLRVHAGSECVAARVIKVKNSKGKVDVKLSKPICAALSSAVAIERKSLQGCFELVAHARIMDGKACRMHENVVDQDGMIEGVLVQQQSVDVPCSAHQLAIDEIFDAAIFSDDTYWRDRFIGLLSEREHVATGAALSLPLLQIDREGGAHSLWKNFMEVVEALGRTPDHLIAFFAAEGSLSCNRAGEGGTALRIAWRSRGLSEKLCGLIRSYVRTYVSCHQCRSRQTDLVRGSSLHHTKLEVVCRSCLARRFVPATFAARI
jgi:translation initiation factor 2 gamma subunit (eIF-2gamma)/translation initiation factor 2 beta subunit (eIF-2beta)/eIF-5